MPTLHDAAARSAIAGRARRLAPDTAARWGQFTAPRMLTHVTDALRMATGEVRPAAKRLPIRYPPLKQLIIYWLPFPRGTPTAPELLARAPGEWGGELAAFEAELEQFGRIPVDRPWPPHPAFGRLSRRAWGVLGYRHIDHHLRQFGV